MSYITRLKRSFVRLGSVVKRSPRRTHFQYARAYEKSLRNLKAQRSKDCNTALVIHLYYTESWSKILKSLKRLEGISFDIYITLPENNSKFIPSLEADCPHAQIMISPNQGRDVLPFLMLAQELKRLGYQNVLKIHTKKSAHRTDGPEWFDTLIDNLLPNNKSVIKDLMKTLDNVDTGIVGPAGQYLELSVNFEANGLHMTRLLNRIYGKSVSHDTLQTNRSEYGFFAGTMFWLRLDAVTSLLQLHLTPRSFELEDGQIDATLAHAVERILSLIPEIESRCMYEISAAGVEKIQYNSGSMPDWSQVYIGPKL